MNNPCQGSLFSVPSHSLDAPKDPCARKHKGNPQSEAAFKRANIEGDRATVLRLLREAGAHGLTRKECARLMNKQVHQISGRFTELVKAKLIAANGKTREHSAVMVTLG